MPIIEIEHEPGVWTRMEFSHQDRRKLLMDCPPERRFVKDKIVYLAHPMNPWCFMGDGDSDIVDWSNDAKR